MVPGGGTEVVNNSNKVVFDLELTQPFLVRIRRKTLNTKNRVDFLQVFECHACQKLYLDKISLLLYNILIP